MPLQSRRTWGMRSAAVLILAASVFVLASSSSVASRHVATTTTSGSMQVIDQTWSYQPPDATTCCQGFPVPSQGDFGCGLAGHPADSLDLGAVPIAVSPALTTPTSRAVDVVRVAAGALCDLADGQGRPLGPAGARRGNVTGTFFHVVAQP